MRRAADEMMAEAYHRSPSALLGALCLRRDALLTVARKLRMNAREAAFSAAAWTGGDPSASYVLSGAEVTAAEMDAHFASLRTSAECYSELADAFEAEAADLLALFDRKLPRVSPEVVEKLRDRRTERELLEAGYRPDGNPP